MGLSSLIDKRGMLLSLPLFVGAQSTLFGSGIQDPRSASDAKGTKSELDVSLVYVVKVGMELGGAALSRLELEGRS